LNAKADTSDLRAELVSMGATLAAKDARIADLEERVAGFEEQVRKQSEALTQLREKLEENSTNSNLPPSSDPPGRANGGKKKRGKRKRGGQKGHRGSHRQLLPPEEVDDFIDFFPPECKSCWKALPEVPDSFAKRYQHTELLRVQPHTTEYRRHAVYCSNCGYRTKAKYDREAIPASAFGPRLMSVVAMLTGDYHLSRRKTVRLMWDVLGVRISLGAVSRIEKRVTDAIEPAFVEAFEQVLGARVKHTDGTSWVQAGVMLSLWTIATAMATVFKILPNGREVTLKLLFRDKRGVLVSDRATALMFWAMKHRQICWAHLVRKFISFSERDGPAGRVGYELLEFTAIIFQYWNDYKSGKLSREEFARWMAPVRAQFEATLRRAVAADIPRLSGSCKNLLVHRVALWTFVERDGVEPTNNHAERELRAFVLWRKRSFGTQSQRGNRFAERLMTIVHTARKQNKNVLAFLTACCESHRDKRAAPSLFEAALIAV
jgi:transposase